MALTKIRPLSEFTRKPGSFLEDMKKDKEPVILTKDGRGVAVLQDLETYQELMKIKDRLEAIAGIRKGMAEFDRGEGRDIEVFFADFMKKHNITEEE